MFQLRVNDIIYTMALWTAEKIREGFEKFYQKKGRYPTVTEIDQTRYLPSSRQIQRKFGGLKNFRKSSGYAINDFGSGKARSEIAGKSGKTGRAGERIVEKILVDHFGEEFVHVEKVWGQTKQRLDFYVYNPKTSFGVEVITAADKSSFTINLNIKIRRYLDPDYPLFFVIINHHLTQDLLDVLISRKKLSLPNKSEVVSLERFIEKISTYPRYYARGQ